VGGYRVEKVQQPLAVVERHGWRHGLKIAGQTRCLQVEVNGEHPMTLLGEQHRDVGQRESASAASLV
jgi:hypothetical protein